MMYNNSSTTSTSTTFYRVGRRILQAIRNRVEYITEARHVTQLSRQSQFS